MLQYYKIIISLSLSLGVLIIVIINLKLMNRWIDVTKKITSLFINIYIARLIVVETGHGWSDSSGRPSGQVGLYLLNKVTSTPGQVRSRPEPEPAFAASLRMHW